MRKILLLVMILLMTVSLVGCMKKKNVEPPQNKDTNKTVTSDERDKKTVTSLVANFGEKMKMVPLLASTDIVNKSMQDNYGSLITPALLKKWQTDPQNAPGRMVSSPWPDRIEIHTNKKISEGTYEVKGEIIEITSTEQTSGGVAAKRPITLIIKKIGNRWQIDNVAIGAYADAESVTYNNTQYGFTFALPKSWRNYSIVTDKWEGRAVSGAQSGKGVETGLIIKIRHPQWTTQKPRQDIPIMIFTLAQFEAVKNEQLSVGAAPIPPSELGQNSKYVFALPARYNYAFPEGFKEVENILANKPLQPTENIKSDNL